MFGLTSFAISGVLILGLFTLRHFEVRRGKRFLPRIRKALDTGAFVFVHYAIKEFPAFLVRIFKYILLQITHFFSSALLYVVRFLEEKLHLVVHKVKGKKNDLVKNESPSNHLTDIKNHKEAVSKTIEELEEVQ